MHDFCYSLDRPPVLLPERKVWFTCAVCKRPGYGVPGQTVHTGRCRTTKTRQNALSNAAKKRSGKQA